ncbi:hypothetical protein [Planococcus sp. CAU13]|uniref:hypothetical protein n=1 Tax=Planococcus sp. CAU13 TaxID=1541197 RepID=UPI001F1B2661|nr:hypothetical protein [Planococcus sp. CAU13]
MIGIIVYFGMQLQELAIEKSRMTFTVFPRQLFYALFPVIIGLLIRTPKFILQRKSNGPLKFDWILFAAVGLPTLYVVVMTFLPFSPLGAGWLRIPEIISIGGATVPAIAGLVFGYVLLDSFKIRNNAES